MLLHNCSQLLPFTVFFNIVLSFWFKCGKILTQCRDSSLPTQWRRNTYCIVYTYWLCNLPWPLDESGALRNTQPHTSTNTAITFLTLAQTESPVWDPDVVAGQLLQLDAAWPLSQQCRCVHTRCTMPLYILTYWRENTHRKRKTGNRQQSDCDAIWQGCPPWPDQSINQAKPSFECTSILLGLLFFCLLVNSCFLIPRPLLHGSGSCCLFTIILKFKDLSTFSFNQLPITIQIQTIQYHKSSSPNPRSDHFSLFFFHLFSFPVCWMVGLQDGLQVIQHVWVHWPLLGS